MFDKTSARRAVLTAVFGVLCILAGYQYAWHKDAFKVGSSVESLLWLALVFVFFGLLIWMAFNRKSDSPYKIFATAVLGLVAGIWGKDVLSGIDTKNLLILGGSALVFIGFVLLIAVKDLSFVTKFLHRLAPADAESPREARAIEVVPDEATVS